MSIVCINQLGSIHCSEVPVFQTTFQGKKVCLGCREIKKNVGLKVLYSPRKGKLFWFQFSGDSGKQCKCMRNQTVREKGITFKMFPKLIIDFVCLLLVPTYLPSTLLPDKNGGWY